MKKGFTLIELLAVILILGIIALIAIPTVNNILKESRRGAFQSTLTNLEKAVEEKCTTEQIKNQEITTMYTIEGGVIYPSLDIKGSLPDGIIYVTQNCEVSFNLSDNNFTGTKEVGGEIIIVDKGNNSPIIVYKEEILNGTDPVLNSSLVPVTIADDGTVTKADISTKWYSYEEKKWANAVILSPSGKIESDGTIKEESIESYFVWIPRYKYKLFDMGNYNNYGSTASNKNRTIEVVFESKDTPVTVGTEVGEYHSHPAFQAFNTNGLWVAKFETTGSTTNVTVKPNEVSLRNINVKTMFETAYNYKRINESHMMKSTEWGAVAYLAVSEYGKNSEVNKNNHSDYITGYSSLTSEPTDNPFGNHGTDSSVTTPYNTSNGYKASTTGNITGIYDMSGGGFEYMAAYSDTQLGNSGFDSNPHSIYGAKYFDVYPSDISTSDFNKRILGDATGELGPFYLSTSMVSSSWWTDHGNMPSNSVPWVSRGGSMLYGLLSGIMNFDCFTGNANNSQSFRIVLAN